MHEYYVKDKLERNNYICVFDIRVSSPLSGRKGAMI